MNYEKLIKEKDEELKRVVKQFNEEVQKLHVEWSQHLAEKNSRHNEKIDKYLETIFQHTLYRGDLKCFKKTVPFTKVYTNMSPVRGFVMITWRSDSEKIDIDFRIIDEKAVNGEYLKKLKYRIASENIQWRSVKISKEMEEGFLKIREVLSKHWYPDMSEKEVNLLKEWMKSYISEEIEKKSKINVAAKRFGI